MDFLAKTLARSRTHRLLWLVYLGAALAVVLNSSLINGALLTRTKGLTRALRFMVLFWPLACSVVILNGFRHVLAIPSELRANWIFQITESQGRAEWMSAVERFVMAYAVAPIYLILFPVTVYVMGFPIALRMTTLQLLVSLSIFEALFHSWQKLPFTCSYEPGKRPLVGIVGGYIAVLCGMVPIISVVIATASQVWFVYPFYLLNFAGIYDMAAQAAARGMGRSKVDVRGPARGCDRPRDQGAHLCGYAGSASANGGPSRSIAVTARRKRNLAALRNMVEHYVDHHAGDPDVEPDRQRPARDLAVLVVPPARPRRSVIIASTGTVAARIVCVSRMKVCRAQRGAFVVEGHGSHLCMIDR